MNFLHLSVNIGSRPKLANGMHKLADGTKVYIRDGEKHRENGPAEIRRDGYQAWFWKGLRHRVNGPAVVRPDGTFEYWENGKQLNVNTGGNDATGYSRLRQRAWKGKKQK